MNYILAYNTSSGMQNVDLDQPTLMIGTLPSNQIVIAGKDIDPIHGLVEKLEDGNWRVTDLGSDSGIEVNGKSIEVERVLNPGDLIKIGSVELTFKVKEAVPVPPAIPTPPSMEDTQLQADDQKAETTVTPEAPSPAPIAASAPAEASAPKSTSAADTDRTEKLFSPREAKPAGDVLEVVAYWGDTVLEVEHFEAGKGNNSKANIGRPPEDDFIAAGPKDLKNYSLAKATEGGYKLKLIEGMKGRLRKSGKVEKVTEGKYSLSRRDIAHIKYGPISYFMLYVRPPKLSLPKSSPRDPLFLAMMNAGLVLFLIAVGLVITGSPSNKQDKADDPWTTRTVEIMKPEKKLEPKKKIKIAKKPPKKPKPPKVKPKPPKPKKPKVVKKKPKPKPKVIVKKANKKPVKVTGNKARKKAPKPKNTKSGMAKTQRKPDFKLAGKKKPGKKGPSGGKRGGGNTKAGSQRKGKQKFDVKGVEGRKNNKASGVNLGKLGLGAGKVLSKSGPGAIQTNFKSSRGGAGGGAGSGRRNLGISGGIGKGRSLGLGGTSGSMNNFGSGTGGLLSGAGGSGGNSVFGAGGRGRGSGSGQVNVNVGSAGTPGVSGGLTAEEVMRVIKVNLNQIRNCYEKVLQRSPNKSGKMKVKFVVAANGRVSSAKVTSDSVRDARMGSCVTGAIKRWKFPNPRGGQKVDINYPFVFNPS